MFQARGYKKAGNNIDVVQEFPKLHPLPLRVLPLPGGECRRLCRVYPLPFPLAFSTGCRLRRPKGSVKPTALSPRQGDERNKVKRRGWRVFWTTAILFPKSFCRRIASAAEEKKWHCESVWDFTANKYYVMLFSLFEALFGIFTLFDFANRPLFAALKQCKSAQKLLSTKLELKSKTDSKENRTRKSFRN